MTVEIADGSVRPIGYVVTILVNAVVLFIVNNLLNWGWPPWLTQSFDQVLPLINASILATMLFTAVYLFYDTAGFKQFGEVVTLAISIAAMARTLAVFPFDFSAYPFDWGAITRTVLVVLLVAMVIAFIFNLGRLVAKAFDGVDRMASHHG